LGDRSRLEILYALSHAQELCVCDIATPLEVKVATASHHLRKLRDLKILKYRNDGKLAYYSLRDRRVSEILSYSLKQLVD
jgi:DNA-binding transcriptional ArsR family regulator